jgi:hypothetical protein
MQIPEAFTLTKSSEFFGFGTVLSSITRGLFVFPILADLISNLKAKDNKNERCKILFDKPERLFHNVFINI